MSKCLWNLWRLKVLHFKFKRLSVENNEFGEKRMKTPFCAEKNNYISNLDRITKFQTFFASRKSDDVTLSALQFTRVLEPLYIHA